MMRPCRSKSPISSYHAESLANANSGDPSVSLAETRRHQLYPVLDAAQVDRRFASGPARDFTSGDVVFEAGERHVPAWLVLKGSIDVVGGDGPSSRPRQHRSEAPPASS